MFRSLIGAGLLSSTVANPLLPRYDTTSGNSSTPTTDWKTIPVLPDIQWIACFENHLCARLEVPLDYSNPGVGTTDIAFIKLPAVNASETTKDLHMNAGGPGASTVDMVLTMGKLVQSRVGSHYNIVGMDNRGVGHSGPNITCFPDNPEAEKLWKIHWSDRVIDHEDPTSYSDHFSKARAFGQWCSEVHRDGPGRYATTHACAADMLRFTEKQAEANGQDPAEAKLWYASGSYGSLFGMTLVTLFPDRMGRVIIDSVLDADQYYNGTWQTTMSDSPAAMQDFFNKCHEAGPEKCDWYSDTPGEIEERTIKLLDTIRHNPIPVVDKNVVAFPTVVTYETVQIFMLFQLYNQLTFDILATGLLDLENRNGSRIVNALDYFTTTASADLFATIHISCLDAAKRNEMKTIEEYMSRGKKIYETSSWVGDGWFSMILGTCVGRDIVPVESQRVDHIGADFPMLFITESIDAATARDDAWKMASRFPGSVVIEQHATAHGYWGYPSKCIDKHITQYLETGRLPRQNITCAIDMPQNPFLDPNLNPKLAGEEKSE